MEVLIVSDIHNDVENLMNYTDKLSLFDFDLIVAIGDFTDYNVPKGFTKVDVAELITEELKTFKKPIFAVPGNFDRELIPFFEEREMSLHAEGKIFENVGFYGFGGARTPFGTPLEPSEEEILNGLKKGYEKVKDCEIKVQVTHMPPIDTKVDLAYTGAHVGSKTIREFIEKYQPNVAACAHIHEARGIDELGRTKLINSGRFPEGYCGILTLEKNKTEVKIVNLI